MVAAAYPTISPIVGRPTHSLIKMHRNSFNTLAKIIISPNGPQHNREFRLLVRPFNKWNP